MLIVNERKRDFFFFGVAVFLFYVLAQYAKGRVGWRGGCFAPPRRGYRNAGRVVSKEVQAHQYANLPAATGWAGRPKAAGSGQRKVTQGEQFRKKYKPNTRTCHAGPRVWRGGLKPPGRGKSSAGRAVPKEVQAQYANINFLTGQQKQKNFR